MFVVPTSTSYFSPTERCSFRTAHLLSVSRPNSAARRVPVCRRCSSVTKQTIVPTAPTRLAVIFPAQEPSSPVPRRKSAWMPQRCATARKTAATEQTRGVSLYMKFLRDVQVETRKHTCSWVKNIVHVTNDVFHGGKLSFF